MGVTGPPDPRVAVFRADQRTSWPNFRLGLGLNVVVVNPGVPREFAWRFETGDAGISSSPVVYGSLILVASNDHRLYAADAATGAIRWRYKAENELMSQPVYDHGLVIVATGNSDCPVYFPPAYAVMGGGVNRIEAVDPQSAREVWSQGIAGTGMPTPAIVAGELVHVDGAGAILSLDARTGAYRWHAATPSFFSMTGVIDGGDGRIYAPGSFPDVIYAWNARNGAILWEHRFSPFYGGVSDGPMASTASELVGMYLEPLARGAYGWVVQYGSIARQHVYALDKRTGRMLWDRTLLDAKGIAPAYNESAIPLVYGNRVYIGSAVAPIVTALDVQSGRIIWRAHTAGAVKGGLVARDGIVYFGDLGGYLWAVDATSGRTIGRKQEPVHFNVGSPIILNDSLIDGSREGSVIAVPLRWIRSAHD
jgi:outer membrane protein assembly factor BamB